MKKRKNYTTKDIIDYIYKCEKKDDTISIVEEFNIPYFDNISKRIYNYLKNTLEEYEDENGDVIYKVTPEFITELEKIQYWRKIDIINLAYYVTLEDVSFEQFRAHCKVMNIASSNYLKKIKEIYQITNLIAQNVNLFKELNQQLKTQEKQVLLKKVKYGVTIYDRKIYLTRRSRY